jgi:hypothetical protein
MRPDRSQGRDALGRTPSSRIVGARLTGAKDDAATELAAARRDLGDLERENEALQRELGAQRR